MDGPWGPNGTTDPSGTARANSNATVLLVCTSHRRHGSALDDTGDDLILINGVHGIEALQY